MIEPPYELTRVLPTRPAAEGWITDTLQDRMAEDADAAGEVLTSPISDDHTVRVDHLREVTAGRSPKALWQVDQHWPRISDRELARRAARACGVQLTDHVWAEPGLRAALHRYAQSAAQGPTWDDTNELNDLAGHPERLIAAWAVANPTFLPPLL